MPETDWQPARLRITHNREIAAMNIDLNIADHMTIRVRETPCMYFTRGKCNATRFYIIHPDDVIALVGRSGFYAVYAVCEHEILTD